MRIAIATVQVPGVHGGAEMAVAGLTNALRAAGHDTQVISRAFRFEPPGDVLESMRSWSREEIEPRSFDRVICVQFPAYYLEHPGKVVWLFHQFRPVYDLWDTPYGGGLSLERAGWELRWAIRDRDRRSLESCRALYTISHNVTSRLRYHSLLPSRAIYHPPPFVPRYRTRASEPFIFFPSRLECHKRQTLLIEALCLSRTGAAAVLAGSGGLREELSKLIQTRGLEGRVRLSGPVSEGELLDTYARCTAVFFGPFDEDYGYVTLEAMLSGKPVITCTDSGGPLEFVVDGETGLVVSPTAEAVAAAIDRLILEPQTAIALGRAGHRRYDELAISWDSVVAGLTG